MTSAVTPEGMMIPGVLIDWVKGLEVVFAIGVEN